ncbi:hypothetical protein ACFL0W_05975 [Nanoarchaeota archaeon]
MGDNPLISDFADLDIILRNSFNAIKRDMHQLKNTNERHKNRAHMLRKSLDELQETFATKDQFNILKRKIADIDDAMKELSEISGIKKQLAQVEKTSAKAKHLEKLKNAFSERLTEQEKWSKSAETTFKTLNEKISQKTKQIKFEQLVRELREEFASVRKDLAYVEKTNGDYVNKQLDNYNEKLNNDLSKYTDNINTIQNS